MPGLALPSDFMGRRRWLATPVSCLAFAFTSLLTVGSPLPGADPGDCHMLISCPFQVRDDNKRQHPCLVEFSKLPEQERNYNLQMSLETLK